MNKMDKKSRDSKQETSKQPFSKPQTAKQKKSTKQQTKKENNVSDFLNDDDWITPPVISDFSELNDAETPSWLIPQARQYPLEQAFFQTLVINPVGAF